MVSIKRLLYGFVQRGIPFLLLLGTQSLAFGQGYYKHSLFDNSQTSDFYFYSKGEAEGKSLLQLKDGKLPVDDVHFFNPPNSLKFEWASAGGGQWGADISVNYWRNRAHRLEGKALSFWCYAPAGMAKNNIPYVGLIADNDTTQLRPLYQFTNNLPAKKWVHIQIPLHESWPRFANDHNINRIQSIRFARNPNDSGHHTLFIDEIKVYTPHSGDRRAPVAPQNVEATAYSLHIDLKWAQQSDDDLSYYVISRSSDGKRYRPVGMQRAGVHRYADYTGTVGKKYFYKIKAVDANYNTSRWSNVAGDSTHALTDRQLLTMVQRASFRYYWEGANKPSGMALENIPAAPNLIATGSSGFGIMALIVGIHRGFISRKQGSRRIEKIIHFLQKTDRFHGVWPHFIDGRTGKVVPLFGKYDDGGDLVETAFLMQGLLVARQFFDHHNKEEKEIRKTITHLWETVEWDWYRKNKQSKFLIWHWSPDHGWHINHPLVGWNETMIVYLLAIASPTHSVPASMYYSGWAGQSARAVQYRRAWGHTKVGDHYENGHTYFGINLEVGVGEGGPLFFTHYSFMGFDPRGKRDRYTNYFKNNRDIALINHAYCVKNPEHYVAYDDSVWGLTASDGPWGYVPHEPKPAKDEGTITPTGAISTFPYTPKLSMKALKYFYRHYGDRLWGIYGFKDAFNPTFDWYARIYTGLNQAPMAVMIENYRSGLIWKLFMSNPEIKSMVHKIGFKKDTK